MTRPLRVATIPADHVYVRHIDPESPGDIAVKISRLADPDPDEPERSAISRWWPPAMLTPEWIARHHDDFDVFHIQFGFDAQTPAQLDAVIDTLHQYDKPLVYTVHDLRNPHHITREAHDEHLDVLIPAADGLVTLTPGAASEIRDRWGREALVLPHPHVVDFARMDQAHTRRRSPHEFRLGVHIKSLRASMDPLPVIRALVEAAREIPDAIVQINGHTDVLDPSGARYDETLAEFLRSSVDRGEIELHMHDFLDDDALWDYLESLDVSVLPYRFGTHSGWLEACRDLGTAVIAPSCGYYRDQGPVIEYGHDDDGLDEDSLRAAVVEAHRCGEVAPVSVAERRAQRLRIAEGHARLYEALAG